MSELKKELGLKDVFSVASGAMISSGLFVLPGIAFDKAGPAMILSYFFASILMIPGLLCKIELATAMPRSGGTYFYVERSLGGMWGIFTGLANWFSLALKSAFAIAGMSALLLILIEMVMSVSSVDLLLKELSVGFCIFFVVLNTISVKHTTRLQSWLVWILLAILIIYSLVGFNSMQLERFEGFVDKGWIKIFSTAGLVFVSFGGLTKVVDLSEEIEQPGRNLPLGMILAWFVVSTLYLCVITVTTGVLNAADLSGNYAPISIAAKQFMGVPGFILLTIAATTAYITTANGGILAASRSPMAMSRDQLLPTRLSRIGKRFATPYISIFITGLFMVFALIFLELKVLAKTASTLMILLFILDNASVIIMRESKIQTYRPKFKVPLYPYINIAAIVLYCLLIIDMGAQPLLISAGFFIISALWYFFYAHQKITRASAVMHIVERVTDKILQTTGLEAELRDILLERDNVVEDRFDKLIKECQVLDINERQNADKVFQDIAALLTDQLGIDRNLLFEKFQQREQESATIIQPGLAIPHIVIDGEHKFEVLLVRAGEGIDFPGSDTPVKIMFVLVGSKDERNYHLRALMAIAQIAQQKNFEQMWLNARGTEGLRNIILLSSRKRDIIQH